MSDDSDFAPMDPGTRMISVVDFRRFEKKIDLLSEAIGKLVLVEERQSNQKVEIAELHKDVEANRVAIEKLQRQVDQWINRGIGVWGVAIVIFAILEFVIKIGH